MNIFRSSGNRSKSVGSAPSSNTGSPSKDPLANLSIPSSHIHAPKSHSTGEVHDERISLSRSDGVIHDLTNVFSSPGVSHIVSTSTKEEKKVAEHDEHAPITALRSDGLTHDLIQVFKGSSDAQGETLKVKAGRAPSLGSLSALLSPQQTSPHQGNPNTINVNREISSLYFPQQVRIVHFSDTHNFLVKSLKDHRFLPHGNILVHTGNFTTCGKEEEFAQFNEWLGSVSDLYHYRVVIFGHRDVKVHGNNWGVMKKMLTNATHVLCHDEAVILGIRFYGAPWHWGHKVNYTVRPGAPVNTTGRFDDIPFGVQCLLTHGPAFDRLDTTYSGSGMDHWGSRELAEAIRRVRPGLHLHGHVKDSRGVLPEFGNNPLTVNSAMVDKDVSVLYAMPHVIRATQALYDKSKNTVTWRFSIDSLEG